MARQTIVISNRIESNLVLTAALEYSSLGLHFGSSTVHQRGGASENSGEMVGWGTHKNSERDSRELRRTQENSWELRGTHTTHCWALLGNSTIMQWGTQVVPHLWFMNESYPHSSRSQY